MIKKSKNSFIGIAEKIDKLKNEFNETGRIALNVKVKTGAAKTEFADITAGGLIKLDLKAVPEKGRANILLIKYMSEEFGAPRENVKIIKGKKDRNKLLLIIK